MKTGRRQMWWADLLSGNQVHCALKRSLLAIAVMSLCSSVRAASTVNSANKFSYGANIGWADWRGDPNAGAVIGEYVCSGYIYSANVGWINLGSGTPANSIQYQNDSATDYGVNQDGLGNLRGFAYGANIGWIGFENSGAPKVDLVTGKMTGSIYSANCGWISLSNAFATVQTDTILPGALAANGLPIAWLLQSFGTTQVLANADADGDSASNMQEYLAGTNPNDAGSKFIVTLYSTSPDGSLTTLAWSSVLTRQYRIQQTVDLNSPWFDSGLGLVLPDGANTSRTFAETNSPRRFFRVKAGQPLAP